MRTGESILASKPRFFSKNGLVWILTIALLAAFVWFLISNRVWRQAGQLGPLLTIGLIGLAVLYQLQIVLGTRILLAGMGQLIPFRNLYLVYTASLPANYTTPAKIGMPLRILLYNRVLDIPVSVGTASIALESVIGLGITTPIALVGAWHLFHERLSVPYTELLLLLLIVGTVLLLARIGVHLPFFDRPVNSRLQRLGCFVEKVRMSVQQVTRAALLGFVLLMFIRIIIRVLIIYVILSRLGYEISPLALLYVQSIAGLIGIVSMLPMGLGAKEFGFVALLSSLTISTNAGALVATADRVLWTVVPFILGIISVNRLGQRWAEK